MNHSFLFVCSNERMDAAAIKERRSKELAEKKAKLEALRRAKQERQAAK